MTTATQLKLSDYKQGMPLIILLILVFLIFPMSIMGQSEKPQTIVVPTASLGEITEVRKKMLEMTLISNLDDHFAIVPKDLFEEAQEKAFEELDYEECTEEQCIMMIKEILQVENSFQLVVLAEDDVTQISVIWNDLDQKRVEEEFCEGCKTKELSKTIENLVQKLIGINKEIEIQDQQPKKLETQAISVFEKLTEPTLEKFQSHEDQKIESKSIAVSKKQSVSIEEKLESSSNTVIDPSTGLMWQKNIGGKYNWIKAKNYCFRLVLQGYSDWILPSKSQLNLVKKSIFNSIDRESFHWSSSKSHDGLSLVINLYSGKGVKNSQTKINLVRCVRKIKSPKEFKKTNPSSKNYDSSSNTVIDLATDLMWQKKPDGNERNWKNAKRYCDSLDLKGFKNWELPSQPVLNMMLSKKDIFDDYKKDGWYWTSTLNSKITLNRSAAMIGFKSKYNGFSPIKEKHLVRCVRNINE